MNGSTIKVSLCDGSSTFKKWEQPCQTDLPNLLEGVKNTKQYINDYLTNLIIQEKDSNLSNQLEKTEQSDEDEEIECDNISGFIKHITVICSNTGRNEKRKINILNQSKKIRK